jgi:catechol 2,3-dioxygenase-like lactoylglutathione lyase family enzyme
MSFRSALARNVTALQPEYVRRAAVGGRDTVFRFSVPVLRVRDVATTVSWYRHHLGFAAESFPENAPHEFAILERDGVQLLVRQAMGTRMRDDGHSGWDLYIWVDGADLGRLEATMALTGGVVRPLSAMGNSVVELEVRDPDGYVLCIGGPTKDGLLSGALTGSL